MLYQPEEDGRSFTRSVSREGGIIGAGGGPGGRGGIGGGRGGVGRNGALKSMLYCTIFVVIVLMYHESITMTVFSEDSGSSSSSNGRSGSRATAGVDAFDHGNAINLDEENSGGNPGAEIGLEHGGEDEEFDVKSVVGEAKVKRLESEIQRLKVELETERQFNKDNHNNKNNNNNNNNNDSNNNNNGQDEQTMIQQQARIFCMVPTMYAKSRFGKLDAVARTWGKRCDGVKFFIDPPKPGQEFPTHFTTQGAPPIEMIQVPIVRDNSCARDLDSKHQGCPRHIWEKVWRSWENVCDSELIDSYDFFLKVDDDTFLFPEFLREYVRKNGLSPEDNLYFGHRSHLARVPFINGACVIMSRAALKAICAEYKKMPQEFGPRSKFKHGRCVDRDGASQEITESICFNQIGVKALPLLDDMGMQMISLFRLSDSLFLRKRNGTKSWYWYRKSRTQVCCSETPVAVHWYKHPSDLLKIDKYLYDPDDKFIEKEMYSRPLSDELKENPKKMVHAVISDVSRIPLYAYFMEIVYLFKVRENLRLIGSLGPQDDT